MSIGRDGEETKEWDRFWNSGRVDDYLRYRGCRPGEKENMPPCGAEDKASPGDKDSFT